MITYHGKLKLHFGLRYPRVLPSGWKLLESRNEFAIGIAPDGKEYFLGLDCAYPRMVADKPHPSLKSGQKYLETRSGVISLTDLDTPTP